MRVIALGRCALQRSLCPSIQCRSSGRSWTGGRQQETRNSNTYGDSSRQQWPGREGAPRYDDRDRQYGSSRPAARDDDEEDHGGDEEDDRPSTIRDQRLGEVLYGVFPVLNALKAKR